MYSSKRSLKSLSKVVQVCCSSSKETVGVIGLGQMGIHMAGNLSKTYNVIGVDANLPLTQERLDSLSYSSVQLTDSIQSLPPLSHILLSLPNNSAVESVVSQLIHTQSSHPLTIIDTSTISPSLAQQCSSKLSSLNPLSLYLDAPVSGGVNGSANASLTFMLGLLNTHPHHHPQQSHSLLSILSTLGKKNVYCGGPGMGQSIKLVNNLALAIQMTSICETFAAGHLLGISPAIQHEVFSTSTSRCWSVDTYVPLPSLLPNVPANNSYNGGFGVDLMLKDLTLCIHEIKQGLHNLKGEQDSQKIWKEQFSVSQAVFDRYEKLSKEYNLGSKDFGVMYKSIEDTLH